MANDFGFIGWCKEDNHDKIWGYFFRPTPGWESGSTLPVWRRPQRNVCVFWGRRGKAMQFKGSVEDSDMHKLSQSKLKKGYTKITSQQLDAIWPTFNAEAAQKLSFEVLVGNVK